MTNYQVPRLPNHKIIESSKVLKKAIIANKLIAELKGLAQTIPNPEILVNTLSLQEAKDSSEIENIVTTHDELFRSNEYYKNSSSANEVHRYLEALFYGAHWVKLQNPISSNLITKLAQIVTERQAGFRNLPGTTLKNINGEIVYTPPQSIHEIIDLMGNLEKFINDSSISDLDPLVKMAVIHHQFESIHPFFDGNGRTGRILNIIYLISEGVIDAPILYLSRFITKNKPEYYRLLQSVREEDKWEDWILYMLTALEITAAQTIKTVADIKLIMQVFKKTLKAKAPNLYSHELMNIVFSHPYTKIEFLVEGLKINRVTASKHLYKMAKIGLLDVHKSGRTVYFVNSKLLNLFTSL